MSSVTRLIEAVQKGDRQAAADLLPLVYDELRKLAAARMAAEAPGHTLDATALVHEAYLRLVGDQQFDGRGHFFAAAAEAMRRILVDHARAKRGRQAWDRTRGRRRPGSPAGAASTPTVDRPRRGADPVRGDRSEGGRAGEPARSSAVSPSTRRATPSVFPVQPLPHCGLTPGPG